MCNKITFFCEIYSWVNTLQLNIITEFFQSYVAYSYTISHTQTTSVKSCWWLNIEKQTMEIAM